MNQTQTGYSLPLTDAAKLAIHRQARRAQAKAISAAARALVTALRGAFTHRPGNVIANHPAKLAG